MKRMATMFLAVLMLLSLAACGAGAPAPPKPDTTTSEKSESEPQQGALSSTSQPEASESSEVQFGDKLDPFQGEWKISEIEKYHRLIIRDDTVNFVSYDNLEKNTVVKDISTFYFGFDENGELVVMNQHEQPRKTLVIDEKGQLVINSLTGGEPDTYEKVSDNTEIPGITAEPSIGMSELEVITSTWGPPKKRNETTTANGKSEQWVYDNGYIYFEDGKVTSIQKR